MTSKVEFSDSNSIFIKKIHPPSSPIGPIFETLVNPIHPAIYWDSGAKVEQFEVLDDIYRDKLRKNHWYLRNKKGKFTLHRIIFPEQSIRNWNIKLGYPENHYLPRDKPYKGKFCPLPPYFKTKYTWKKPDTPVEEESEPKFAKESEDKVPDYVPSYKPYRTYDV